jgi:hypothetical protein
MRISSSNAQKAWKRTLYNLLFYLVELGGIEPPTSCMPCKRSPS